MPRTRSRAEEVVQSEIPIANTEGPTASRGVARERARAKSKPQQGTDTGEEHAPQVDDLEDTGKTLHVKDGRLGFVTNKGFTAATNFIVDFESQVFSQKYSIKGTNK